MKTVFVKTEDNARFYMDHIPEHFPEKFLLITNVITTEEGEGDLDYDMRMVQKAVHMGFRDQDSSNAWERIKHRLREAEKTEPCPNCGKAAGSYSTGNACKNCHTEL